MLKNKCKFIGLITILIVILTPILYNKQSSKTFQKMFFSMDTIITIETNNQNSIDRIYSQIEELNNTFDRHSPNTELYLLNSFKSIESDTLANLIIETSKLNQIYGHSVNITSGKLVDIWNISENPTIPTVDEISKALETISMDNVSINDNVITLQEDTSIDVGAIAKGYTLDVIKSTLDDTLKDTYISMGSSTLLYNVNKIPISIRSPENTENVACRLSIDGTSYISTSGGYERYIEIDGIKYPHILDLNTGYPVVTDLTSVTVCADSGIKSDFLSTCIFMGGTKNLQKYLNDSNIKVIAIDEYKKVYVSKGLKVEILDSEFTLND